MSTLAISVLQGFFLGIVLGVSKHTREHSNVAPQIIALLMELGMKMLTTVPSWVQCLPSRLVSSSSLHFACVLSTFRPSTWHERSCWVKNWCWRALATRMNCHKSNSILSLWPYVAISSRPSSTGQQLESLHPAVQVFFLFFAKILKDQVLVCFQQRNVVTGFTNTKITGLLQNTANFHCGACVPWTSNR